MGEPFLQVEMSKIPSVVHKTWSICLVQKHSLSGSLLGALKNLSGMVNYKSMKYKVELTNHHHHHEWVMRDERKENNRSDQQEG